MSEPTMQVLHVINGLGTGGAERSLAEMLPGFVERGIEPTVATLYSRAQGVEAQVRAQGIAVRLLHSSTLPGRVLELRRILRTARPDLVHTAIFDADLAGRLAAAGTGIPVLTSLVNTSYEPARLQDPAVLRWRLRAVQLVEAVSGRLLTAHFHAVSHAVARSAVTHLRVPRERITVVHRGRDPSRLGVPSADRRQRCRRSLGIDDRTPVVVAAGRQEFQKGHAILLDAIARLSSDTAPLLLLAGREGGATRSLQEQVEHLHLEERVRFLGHRDDLPDVLAAADLFAFPSLFEGLGGVLIEAMALGLPVVASDLPAVREVVEPGGNGLLVPPGDPAALAAAVDELLTAEDERRRLGVRSREIFDEHFWLERSVEGMVRLYHMVDRRNSRAR